MGRAKGRAMQTAASDEEEDGTFDSDSDEEDGEGYEPADGVVEEEEEVDFVQVRSRRSRQVKLPARFR